MSANNMIYATRINDKWYGWETQAEAVNDDLIPFKGAKDGYHLIRKLSKSHAYISNTMHGLLEKIEEDVGTTEYGLSLDNHLFKDGTLIQITD